MHTIKVEPTATEIEIWRGEDSYRITLPAIVKAEPVSDSEPERVECCGVCLCGPFTKEPTWTCANPNCPHCHQRVEGECCVKTYSSAVCNWGTKSCVLRHSQKEEFTYDTRIDFRDSYRLDSFPLEAVEELDLDKFIELPNVGDTELRLARKINQLAAAYNRLSKK